jgi:hypothetical protein
MSAATETPVLELIEMGGCDDSEVDELDGLESHEVRETRGFSLVPAERETTITVSDADDVAHIWTAQRSVIGQLRRHRAFTEVRSGKYGATEWAAFTIPVDEWNPARGAKRAGRSLTDAQKCANAQRLADARRKQAAQTGAAAGEGPGRRGRE